MDGDHKCRWRHRWGNHGQAIRVPVLVVEALHGCLTRDHTARHTMLQVNTVPSVGISDILMFFNFIPLFTLLFLSPVLFLPTHGNSYCTQSYTFSCNCLVTILTSCVLILNTPSLARWPALPDTAVTAFCPASGPSDAFTCLCLLLVLTHADRQFFNGTASPHSGNP